MKRFLALLLSILLLAGMIPAGLSEEVTETASAEITAGAVAAEESPAEEAPAEEPASEEGPDAEEEPAEVPPEEPVPEEEIPAEEAEEELLPEPEGEPLEKEDTILTEKNFPDEALLSSLEDQLDPDEKGYTAESAARVTRLEFNDRDIWDLTGIRKFFPNLEELCLYGIGVKTIDMSGMKKLRCLDARGCRYCTGVTVTGCTSLETLYYADSAGGTVVGLPSSLKELTLQGVHLKSLSLGSLKGLTYLDVSENSLTKLDLTGLTELQVLLAAGNDLASLNVTCAPSLTKLDCERNKLGKLDAGHCPDLEELLCGNNRLSSLIVSGRRKLRSLDCRDNLLTSLDLSDLPVLKQLNAAGNRLTGLELGGLTALRELDVSENLLISLEDLRGLNRGGIEGLRISGNRRWNDSYLDLNGFADLRILECSDLGLEALSLPMSNTGELSLIRAEGNHLRSLDLSYNRSLEKVYLRNNKLSVLDVTGCVTLSVLEVYGNCLEEIRGLGDVGSVEGFDLGTDEKKGRVQSSGDPVQFWKIGELYFALPELTASDPEYFVIDVNGKYIHPGSEGVILMDAEPKEVCVWRLFSAGSGRWAEALIRHPVTMDTVRFTTDAEYLAAQRGSSVSLSLYGPDDWLPEDCVSWACIVEGELGAMDTGTGWSYTVPQFAGVPTCDVHVRLRLPGYESDETEGAILRCRVDTVDQAAKGVSLTDTKVSVDLASTDYTRVRILPEFPELMKGDGNAVSTVWFANDELDEWFEIRVLDDRNIQLRPKAVKISALEAGTLKLPKTALKSKLIVWCLGRQFVTPETLSITVSAKLPVLKAKELTLNSYVPGTSVPVVITGGTVTNIFSYGGPAWLDFDSDTMRAAYSGEAGKKLSGVFTIGCRVEGCAVSGNISVKVTVKPIAPKLSLSKRSVTLYSGTNDFASVRLKLNDPYKSEADLVTWEVVDIYGVPGSRFTDREKQNVHVQCVNVDTEKGFVTVGLAADGQDIWISGTARVVFSLHGESTALTVKLVPASKAKAKMTLKAGGEINAQVRGSCLYITPTISGIHAKKGTFLSEFGKEEEYDGYLYDFTVDEIIESGTGKDVLEHFEMTDYQAEVLTANRNSPYAIGPWIQLWLKDDGWTPKPGCTYTASVTADSHDFIGYEGGARYIEFTKEVKLPITNKAAAVSVKFTTSGSLSASDPGENTDLKLYPTFTNAPLADASDLTFEVYRTYDASAKKKISEKLDDSWFVPGPEMFDVLVVRFRASNYGERLEPGDKYTVCVYYRGTKVGEVPFTVECAALKPQYTSGTLLRGDAYSVVRLGKFPGWDAFTMINRLIRPGLLKLDKTSAKWFELGYDDTTMEPVIRWKDGIVPEDAAKWKAGTVKTVKLTLSWPGIRDKSFKCKITIK